MFGRLPHRLTLQHTAVRTLMAGGFGLAALAAAEGWGAGAAEPVTEVWVTTHALAAGDRIAAGDVALRRWPAGLAAPGWLGRARSPVGQTTAAQLAAGTPVDAAMLAEAGGGGLGASLRPGRRAISIAVGPAAGLAGFLAPGDRVDVLLIQTVGKRRSVQTLLGGLTVLGVDQRRRGEDAAFEDGPEPPALVTLEVSPREAESLAVAAELGTLSLVLRGPGQERGPAPGRGPRWDSEVTGLPASLFAEAAPPALRAPEPAPPAAAPPPAAAGVAIHYGLAPASAAEPAGPAK